MRRATSPARTRSAVAALALLASLASATAHAHGALTHGRELVDAATQRLADRWRKTTRVTKVTQMGGKSAKVLSVYTAERQAFIVRRPRRGLDHGLRVNRAQHLLAAAMGEERMVPAAIVDTTPSALDAEAPVGTQVMVVRHVGNKYVNASRATAQQLAAIPERAKLVGAIVDLLSEQQDRKSENILVRTDGTKLKLIDPDKSFGQRSGAKYRSQFFHGGMVGFTSSQARFSDLPPDLQTFIANLAVAGTAKIQKVYGLAPEEAAVVAKHAARIQQVGLAQAIDEYVATLGELHPPK